jgi:hypothetical protein
MTTVSLALPLCFYLSAPYFFRPAFVIPEKKKARIPALFFGQLCEWRGIGPKLKRKPHLG